MRNDLYVGQSASVKRIVTAEDVEKYAELTGDHNGLHLDDEIAQKSVFGKRVCHGMLIGSFISTVLGTCLPGEGTIYLSQEILFKKPVFLEEEIEITVEIETITEENGIVILKTIVTKSDGTVAVSGNAKVMLS